MSKRFTSLLAAAGAVACTGALAAGASGASSPPTMNLALSGTKGITVSGSTVSGAVNIVSTFTGTAPSGPNSNGPTFALFRLNPGATIEQATAAVKSHHGDLNALGPYGALLVSAGAPGTVQTVLTPGNWAALNVTGNGGQPGISPFVVTASPSPAALPAASGTQTAIDFAFHGPKVLHNGTVVRAQNLGYVVHMIIAFNVKNAATGRQVIALLLAGKDKKAQKLAGKTFLNLQGPVSSGGLQQAVLKAKPGYYVEACFMNAQDGREHTRLGMERLIRIVK